MPRELKARPETASMNPCSSRANTDRPGVLSARFLKDAMIRLYVALLSSVYHERFFAPANFLLQYDKTKIADTGVS